MDFWDEVRRDVQKGLREGMALVKAGATIAVKKVDELTVEGKKRFQTFDLKTKVHNEIADLGARMYELARDGKVELKDARARTLFNRIQKLETEISGVQAAKPPAAKGRKKTTRKTSAKKKAAPKKTTARKKTATTPKTVRKKTTRAPE